MDRKYEINLVAGKLGRECRDLIGFTPPGLVLYDKILPLNPA